MRQHGYPCSCPEGRRHRRDAARRDPPKGRLHNLYQCRRGPGQVRRWGRQDHGPEPQLLRAAAKVLGTEAQFQEGTFDAMVPGLEAKRYDAIASVADFVERQTRIDFIDYLKNGTAIIASKNFDKDQVTPEQFCGMSIGYARGTSQQGNLEKYAQTCAEKGSSEAGSQRVSELWRRDPIGEERGSDRLLG
ncbi:transporter substrate-binding domain-containing protein [Arthrobacter sp. MMS24-T111]